MMESFRGILAIERHARSNGRQPQRLHLRIQWEAFVQVPRQGFGPSRVARQSIRQRRFHSHPLTRGSELQPLRCGLFRFRGIAESGFAESGILLPNRPAFLAVCADGGCVGKDCPAESEQRQN